MPKFKKKSIPVILMLLLLVLSGCANKIEYVRDSSRPIAIKAGKVSPVDGYVLNPEAFADLMDCCEQRVE